jgi:hypothetical protein
MQTSEVDSDVASVAVITPESPQANPYAEGLQAIETQLAQIAAGF